jgi:hypothetical protein
MPDHLAPLLATNHLAAAMFIMIALQNTKRTRSPSHQTGVTEAFLIEQGGFPLGRGRLLVGSRAI